MKSRQIRNFCKTFGISLISGIFLFLFTGSNSYSQSVTIRINEFMALNQKTLADEDNDFSDWIEFYNPSSADIDLSGWSVTDNKSNARMWVFPDITLSKGGYLIIFASGKDRSNPDEELHSNFKLSGDGEYLGLYNSGGKVVTEFDPFPLQQTDFSYGYLDGSYTSFKSPTPGAENNPAGGLFPAAPSFSHEHGFFDSSFNLEISAATGYSVYYTTDGSAPSETNGSLYNAPLTISTTAVIRAICIKEDMPASRITTRTYLFVDDIIHQPSNPPGYPSTWGPFLSISGTAPADYEMDPEMIADQEFADEVKEGLRDLPVISIATNRGYIFSKTANPDTGGIYIYTGTAGGFGDGWERPVSFEFFGGNESVSFQADCGIQIHGGEGRRPEKSPKHSFMLTFKDQYGPSKFNYPVFGENAAVEHNKIILRAGFGNTWIHWSHSERSKAQYLRDRWTKDTQLAMGRPSSHGIYVHLFINGLYWGIYNPSEKMDSEFAETYLGGNAEDYDVVKDYAEAVDGNLSAWNSALSIANAGLAGDAAYQRIRGNNPDGSRNPAFEPLIDAVSLADYMILNFYGGNTDWDHHNWVAIRNRVNPGNGFQFFCWDSEHMIEGVNSNLLNENNDKCPSRIFQQMRQNKQFRMMFADRVQKFCFNNGLLTPVQAAWRWMTRAGEIDKAIVAESARWGDYRRDVHPWQTAGPFHLYTKETHWLDQQNYLMNTWFPDRTKNFINHLKLAGLFPSINAPVFLINNQPVTEREISPGDLLSITSGNGVIYFTTDGSDPVITQTDQKISPNAIQYLKPLTLSGSSHIKARVLYNNEWSAVSEQFFIVPAEFKNLKITEIHYHPLDESNIDNSEFEFIEIKNTGTSALDLGRIRLAEAIDFTFPAEVHLGPKSFMVLASNLKEFYRRYSFLPFAEYDGQLDNNGEMLVMIGPDKDTLCRISYEDGNGWPEDPDGMGTSLVPIDPDPSGDQNMAEFWRGSYREGGSPGEDDLYITQTGTALELVTLYQNYPNPFSYSTKLSYKLNEDAYLQLQILDITGRLIATLEDGRRLAGNYEAEWNGTNDNNNIAGNGLYFYRIIVKNSKGTNVISLKMLLVK